LRFNSLETLEIDCKLFVFLKITMDENFKHWRNLSTSKSVDESFVISDDSDEDVIENSIKVNKIIIDESDDCDILENTTPEK